MREAIQRHTLQPILQQLALATTGPGSIYLVGGACAIWYGWRETTVDLDIALAPEPAGLFSAIERLKQTLHVNIELASPGQFVPELPCWQGRSDYLFRANRVDFYHFDFYTQALAKFARDYTRDRVDIACMLQAGKLEPSKLLTLVEEVRPLFKLYPHLTAIPLLERVTAWVKMHVST